MNKFDTEITRILDEVYYNPISSVESIAKRAVVKTEFRYVEYLVSIGLVKKLTSSGGGTFGLQLTNKGHEVYEKHKSWIDYKKKVVSKREKVEKAKSLAIRYWWLPVLISFISLALSLISLIF